MFFKKDHAMKRISAAFFLTIFLISAGSSLLFARSENLQPGDQDSVLDSAVAQTLRRVEAEPARQGAPEADIPRPPQAIPLPEPVVPAVTGSAAVSPPSSVSGPAAVHQEPPFYVNPLSQTVRQVRDLVNGLNSPTPKDAQASGPGQLPVSAAGNAAAAAPASSTR